MHSSAQYIPIFSRPGRSQGLLYKQSCDSFIHSVCEPFPPTALRRPHAQTGRYSSSSYKIDYVIVIKNFLLHCKHPAHTCVVGCKERGWGLTYVDSPNSSGNDNNVVVCCTYPCWYNPWRYSIQRK